MKKLAAIILMMLYSFATVGTTIAMHYCMGDRMGASLGYSDQKVCDYCHMEKNSGADPNHCCKDKNYFVKVTSDQNIPVFSGFLKVPAILIHSFLSGNDTLSPDLLYSHLTGVRIHPPDIPLYQRHCNFRI